MNFIKNIYEVEIKIRNLIKNDNNCSAHFKLDTSLSEGKKKLSVITYNPKTETQFLLHSIESSESELDLYIKMYNYIKNLKDTFKKNNNGVNYTIQWYNCKKNKTETSHFYGNTLEEILNKFYFEKSRKTTIFLVKLNPES